ncbi:MAG: ABC transporter ATP-binding protein [Gammaproteobacteria bacterium]|nr:ABC transporter ATP-binding protein [Gammaproteobacteria bacterium]
MRSEAVLTVNGLALARQSARGPQSLVRGVDLALHAGRTTVLVGESGSGKTLTALAIAGLLPPGISIAGGSIRFGDCDLASATEQTWRGVRGRGIGMIFQDAQAALNPLHTVGYQLREVLAATLPAAARRPAALKWLEAVGIVDTETCYAAYPHELSGGMRQRVMIAAALALQPKVLLADEPTTALDVTVQAQILKLLSQQLQRLRTAVLFITHDLAVAAEIADDIVVMQQGEIVEQSSANEFFRLPRHPYSRQLMDAVLDPDAAVGSPATNGDPTPVLSASAIDVAYSQHAWRQSRMNKVIDNVSMTLCAGRTLAVVGESGSGKSTLARALLRITPIAAGRVCWLGNDVSQQSERELRARRHQVQWVMQDPYAALNPTMTVAQIIGEGMANAGLLPTPAQRSERVAALLQQVGLDPVLAARGPRELSGGQCQRVCIARALACQPAVLVCDEPTSALDVTVQRQVLALLAELRQVERLACLLITHDLGIVRAYADDVIVLHRGRVVEAGIVVQVLDAPAHEYTRQLLDAVPRLPRHQQVSR